MKVKTIRLGYYDLKRRRPGDVFEMDECFYSWKDKEGNQRTCSWVEPVDALKAKKDEIDLPKKAVDLPKKKPTGDAKVI